jgi:predicted nucleic acid-binding protein
MEYQKKTSEDLDEAHRALAELELGPLAHMGNRLAIAALAAQIAEATTALNKYNQMVDQLEASEIALKASEAEVQRMSDEILAAIAAKYGIDSYEYEVASGQRPIGSKRPRKKRTKSRAKPRG